MGVEGVHKLWQGPSGAHDAEHGQKHAPSSQWTSEVKRRPEEKVSKSGLSIYSLCVWPVRHVGLASEYEEHVDTAGPCTHRPPVLLHPYPDHRGFEILSLKLPLQRDKMTKGRVPKKNLRNLRHMSNLCTPNTYLVPWYGQKKVQTYFLYFYLPTYSENLDKFGKKFLLL